MTIVMENVFELIRQERERQDKKWGADRDQDDYVWETILTEEVGEAAESILKDTPAHTTEEVIQIAAVATAWLECMLRRMGEVR